MTHKASQIFYTEEYANFAAEVHAVLLTQPNGISEYDLLQLLKHQSRFSFVRQIFENNLSLFYAHFILFHCLYKLRVHLLDQQLNQLEISALNIQLHLYTNNASETALIEADPMQAFYLDATQIDNHNESSLSEMIGNFWHTLIVHDARPQALLTLGLCDPVSDDQIKKTWRKLVMKYHPDRGGDTKTLQSINKAFNILIP